MSDRYPFANDERVGLGGDEGAPRGGLNLKASWGGEQAGLAQRDVTRFESFGPLRVHEIRLPDLLRLACRPQELRHNRKPYRAGSGKSTSARLADADAARAAKCAESPMNLSIAGRACRISS